MRIVMLSVDFLPNIGGIAGHIRYLSQALEEQGHEVVVVNPVPGERGGERQTIEAGLSTIRVPVRDPDNRALRVVQRARDLRASLRKIADSIGGFDVLHQHDHRTSSLGARGYEGAAWVWTNHTSEFLEDYERPLARQLIRWMYGPAKGMITVSREIQRKTLDLWPEKNVVYVPNGVDIESFSPETPRRRERFGVPADSFVVLCPRRIAPKNGVVFFARAARRLLSDEPGESWHFALAGSDPTGYTGKDRYLAEVRSLLEPARAEGDVTFLGNVPAEEMPEVNALADVVVIPSLMEAVSLSALEAMATGVPVIASDVGGLPEVIRDGETGVLVPPEDPTAIAEALRSLRRDGGLRSAIARRARRLVEDNYSWREVATQTADFYRTVVREG